MCSKYMGATICHIPIKKCLFYDTRAVKSNALFICIHEALYFPCFLHVGSVLCCFGFNLDFGTQFLRRNTPVVLLPGQVYRARRVSGVIYFFWQAWFWT